MSVIGYDSTNLVDIPVDAQLVLYYLNGSWPASDADLARFTSAMKEGISVTPFANVGKWLDVETGDAFPWQAPDWCVMRRAAGEDPGVYVQYSAWAATKTEFALRGVAEPHWWIALWDGVAVLLEGAIGKQYAANHPGTPYYSGGHYDKSIFNYVFGPGGGTLGGDEMRVKPPFTVETDADTHWFGTPGGQDMGAMGQRTVQIVTVSSDGQWYEYPGSTWWFAAAKSSLILSTGQGPKGDKGDKGDPGPVDANHIHATGKPIESPTGGV